MFPATETLTQRVRSESKLFGGRQLELIGVVPENQDLTYCRAIDIHRSDSGSSDAGVSSEPM